MGEKKWNKASMRCDTISKGLVNVELESPKESRDMGREKILEKTRSKYFQIRCNPTDSTKSTKLNHKKHGENCKAFGTQLLNTNDRNL